MSMPIRTVNTFNLKELEKEAVIAALECAKGNVTITKELLGVAKSTVYKLLKDYNIDQYAVKSKYLTWRNDK